VSARDLLDRAAALGVRVELAARDRLRAHAAERLTPELRAELREHKAEILALLLDEQEHRAEDAAERFDSPHAAFFPWLGKEVSTPLGRGVLIQVFADFGAVVLDGDRAAFFDLEDLRP